MHRRLFSNQDNSYLANSINNLGTLRNSQKNYVLAELLYKEALEMRRRLFKKRDNNDLANSINNLVQSYYIQEKYSEAEALFIEALAMRRQLFDGLVNHDLTNSINNLASVYTAQQELQEAFPLRLEVEENILRQWLGYSTESNRLVFVETNQIYLKQLVSFLCQYFPDDSEKIAQVAIAVARRKAFAAQAIVALLSFTVLMFIILVLMNGKLPNMWRLSSRLGRMWAW